MEQNKYPALPVLLVDDEEQFLLSVSVTLYSSGINNIIECNDSSKVMELLSNQKVEAILLDISMPKVSGTELLAKINQEYPEIPAVMVTAISEIETAVECMKSGAFDYLLKPVDDNRLVTSVKRAIEMREVRNENSRLKQYLLSDSLQYPEAFSSIVTKNSTMRSIFQYIEAVAATPLPILATGETGAGKELIAKSVHNASNRKGEFVTVNIAGVDDNLFSDTLFGHVKGAFTGADKERKGLIEEATGGTLFLDEIGDLKKESQVKLLRLIQEGNYYPVGSDTLKSTDARIVVATNCDINAMQKCGEFRKDLYYRLQSHHIQIPPLRERIDDVPLLTEYFLQSASEKLSKKKPTPPKELYTLLATYNFPGNVRELEGMIFDSVSRHKSGVLSMKTFKDKILDDSNADKTSVLEEIDQEEDSDNNIIFRDKLPTLKETEKLLIDEALKRANGNQTIAAQILGMTRTALNNRLIRSRK